MKHISIIILSILCCHLVAANPADTVQVKMNRVPVMLERTDNVICYLRLDAAHARMLDEVVLSFGKDTDIDNIAAVRLYYSGTEAPQYNGQMRYAPVQYISRDNPKYVRDINPTYSILKSEVKPSSGTIRLEANQQLWKGINYFWVSVQMKPGTSVHSKMSVSLDNVLLDRKTAIIAKDKDNSYTFRMGAGVRYAGDDNSAAYRIPGMVTTNAGTLLGVYDVRYNSSIDLQEYVDIGVSRSTDGGQTWEPMRIAMSFGDDSTLPKAQNGVGDPAILVDKKTGTIWVIAAWTHGMGNGRAWHNSGQGMDKSHTAQLMLVKSDDDGRTWSEPINITGQVKKPEWYFLLQGPGMGITMEDGTLVFAAQYIDADRMPYSCIIYSKDNGQNWQLHNAPRSNTTEAQVAEVTPGVLMLNMRDNRGGSRAVYTTSDMGRTWAEHPSSRSVLQEPVCMASLINVKAKDNVLNKDILLFSNPNSTKSRNMITIKASLDGGKTFPDEYQVMLDEGHAWGYSCLTMIDRETVGILYEGSTAHMVFQAVKLTDIIRK